jgi:hypothetical protein
VVKYTGRATKARCGLGPGWATVFTLRAGTTRPKNCLGFSGPNPFSTKHDGLGPGWPGPAQFPALSLAPYSPGSDFGPAQVNRPGPAWTPREVLCVVPGILPRVPVCCLSTRHAWSNETKICVSSSSSFSSSSACVALPEPRCR